jgi:NADPH2 dehydrogenase
VPFTTPGQHATAASFRAHLRAVDPGLDCESELEDGGGPLGWPLAFRGRKLLNRFAVQPLAGGDATAEGEPTDLTLMRWRNFGRSGAKLVWGGEAFAVDASGRSHPRQLFHNPELDAGAGLARLFHQLRQGHREIGADPDELFVGLQLTHAGRFARPDGTPRPRCAARHPALDGLSGVTSAAGVVTDGELEDLAERFVDAAELAWRVGFHFVDVKCCHGNLLHELLGARSRPGRYGGAFDARGAIFV